LPLTQSSIDEMCSEPYILDGTEMPANQIRKVGFFDIWGDDLKEITKIPNNFLNNCINLEDIDLTYLKYVREIGDNFMIGCSNLKVIRTGFLNADWFGNNPINSVFWLSNDTDFNNFPTIKTEYDTTNHYKAFKQEYKKLPELPNPDYTLSKSENNLIISIEENTLFTSYTLKYSNEDSDTSSSIIINGNTYILPVQSNKTYTCELKGNIGKFSNDIGLIKQIKT